MQPEEVTGEPVETRLRLDGGADPLSTLAVLWQGPTDPQMRIRGRSIARAMRFGGSVATLELRIEGQTVAARAWGPGARQALEALPALVGERDDPTPLVPRHPLIAELARRYPGLRLTSGSPVIEVLVPSILAQKVTSIEARSAHGALLARFGERAPGPLGLMLPPPPRKLAALPYWALHPLGIERRRAEAIRAAAAVAAQLEEIRSLPADLARARLTSVPGIGQWTAAETMRLALGDPDAVSVGDFNLPNVISWALSRQRTGDDARMLELLEPYRGQRARVVLLIERSGLLPPRRAQRMRLRSIASI